MKYLWFVIAVVAAIYAVNGLVTGEVVFSSTSRMNARELKLVGLPAFLMSLCSLCAAIAFGSMGAAAMGTEHTPLFERITKPALFACVFFFLATAVAVVLR